MELAEDAVIEVCISPPLAQPLVCVGRSVPPEEVSF
jgi:hypothetical protein